jgi:hypothetical protein
MSDIKGITIGIAANGNVTLVGTSGEVKAQVDTVQNSTTLGNSYASCEVWDRAAGLVCRRVFAGPITPGPDLVVKPVDVEMEYAGTAPTFTLEGIGLWASDSVASVTSGTAVFTVKDSSNNTIADVTTAAAGTYKIVLSGLTLASGKVYNFSLGVGTLTIKKKKLTVTADNKSINEFGSAPEYTATYSGFVSGESSSNLTGSLSYAIKDADGVAVTNVAEAEPGTYQIIPSGVSSDNYDIEFVPGELTIEALPDITITAADKTMTAGGSEPEYTATATGDFADGEDISDLTGTLSYTIKDSNGETVADVTAADPGTYSIIPSGLTSGDYDIHFVAGELTIEAGS